MYNEVKYQTRTTCELRQEECKNCSVHWQKILSIEDHETNLGEFDIFFCQRCKLGFTNPYPTEETVSYLYETKESSDFDIVRNSPIDYIKDFLSRRQITRLAPSNHVRAVLDYATGNGRFAATMAKVFPNARVDAMDFQATPPPLLQRPGNKVNYYNQVTFAEQHQQYDLIIVRHVLEHTHHPVQLVKYLSEHLAQDGLIYIEVPNLDSGCAKVFGKYWKGYYVPRHIFHYTIASLTEIVDRAGLVAKIGRNEMPLMGNILSILTGLDKTNVFVQGIGILLHPVQLAIETLYRSSTCINARCKYPKQPA